MEISQEIIQRALKVYKPEMQMLKTARLDYPKMSGKFLIGDTYYTLNPAKHATDIEIQLCLNQLLYAGLAEIIKQQRVPQLEGIDFERMQTKGMFIVKSLKRFGRQINPSREIYGEVTIGKLKKLKGVIVAETSFNFENRSCFGNLELAIARD